MKIFPHINPVREKEIKMNNKYAILISVTSLIISLVSLSHDILIKEYGLLIGNTEYIVKPSKKLNIENKLKGLSIAPITEIHNNGTIPIRINKAKAYIKFGSEEHIFDTMSTAVIGPGNITKGQYWLRESLNDKETYNRDILDSKISFNLMEIYHKEDVSNGPIFLEGDLYDETVSVIEENVKWMVPDKDYYLLFMLWVNTDEEEPNRKFLYKFSISQYQIDVLSKFQAESYKSPTIYSENKFVTYTATPTLKFIADESKTNNIYEAFKRFAVEVK